MVSWPAGVRKTVLRETTWELPSGTIADKTRSGKYKVRAGHASEPMPFAVAMHLTLDEYRILESWYIGTTRKGALSFGFPKINDTVGTMVEYRFVPGSRIAVSNPGALILNVRMEWIEA
jgi:hypothetical protein